MINVSVKSTYYKYNIINKLAPSSHTAHILMFNNIVKDGETADKNFSQMSHFIERINCGLEPVSIDELLGRLERGDYKGYINITFDDGKKNVLENAYPYLKSHNIPFTVYIVPGRLGDKGYMTEDDVRLLSQDELCTVGAHTMTHPHLSECENAEYEIEQSAKEIERITGKTVKHFAYPYGGVSAVSKKNIETVKRCGYLSAVSTVGTRLKFLSAKNWLFLPRINGDI